jgi:hypothetical protein
MDKIRAHQGIGSTRLYLWSFGSGTDGKSPYAGLIMDVSGNLCGTTFFGGAYIRPDGYGLGTVFKLKPPSTEGGRVRVLRPLNRCLLRTV